MMQWEQTDDADFVVPDDVLDLSFRIECAQLPVDHARDLYRAIAGVLPWLEDEPCAAIHSIFDAASGNGWVRPAGPADTAGELMQLSKRTRLYLRLPRHRVADAGGSGGLSGHTLDVGGYPLTVGNGKTKPLSAWPTIFARSVAVAGGPGDDEGAFSRAVAADLAVMNIRPPKLLCGLLHSILGNGATLSARSVMLADLTLDESIRLQQNGLGANLKIGCGIFLPHKSIAAVAASPNTT